MVAVAPSFYGFLNQLGVTAPIGIQRFYYVAYPFGVLLSLILYALLNIVFNPALESISGWDEPRDYVDEFDGMPMLVVTEGVEQNGAGIDEVINAEKSEGKS